MTIRASAGTPPSPTAPEPHIAPGLLPDLPHTPKEDAALLDSLVKFGVIVAIIIDQYGRILDGRRRFRLGREANVKLTFDVIPVRDDEHARMIAIEVNTNRRQLTRQQRRELVAHLTEVGHSVRGIAKAVGASTNTVNADRKELSRSRQLTLPTTVTGLDGKAHPSRVSIVRTRSSQEVRRTLDALQTLGDDAPSGQLSVKRVERLALEAKVERCRRKPVEKSTIFEGCELRVGDFRLELADLAANSVDLIFCDPPFTFDDDVKLYDALGAFAAKVLKPGQRLMAYCGRVLLFDAANALRQHLTRVSLFKEEFTRFPVTHRHNVVETFLPILVFSNGEDAPHACLKDSIRTPKFVRKHHKWEKPTETASYYIEKGTPPRALIIDPFMGSGTTAVASLRTGRRFIGCDIDAANVGIARERLAAESSGIG